MTPSTSATRPTAARNEGRCGRLAGVVDVERSAVVVGLDGEVLSIHGSIPIAVTAARRHFGLGPGEAIEVVYRDGTSGLL